MVVLLDEDGYAQPTFLNIIEAFKKLSEESQPGDAVFVQFSGHGGRVLDATEDAEAESYDEVIVPIDYKQAGLIRDTLIFKTLLAPMRYGVTVTIMIDCCDTGMLLELPYCWIAKSDRKDVAPKVSL
jgi:metacaspase-1